MAEKKKEYDPTGIGAMMKDPNLTGSLGGQTRKKTPPKVNDPNEEINKGVVNIVKDWFKRQRDRWAKEAEPNIMPVDPNTQQKPKKMKKEY